jgi:hypothetical protein
MNRVLSEYSRLDIDYQVSKNLENGRRYVGECSTCCITTL